MANWLTQLFGSRNQRILHGYSKQVSRANALEDSFKSLSDEQLRGKTDEFRARLEKGEQLDDLLPEAFAAVREAAQRTLGMRHFDVQLIGGMALWWQNAVRVIGCSARISLRSRLRLLATAAFAAASSF